MNNNDMVEKLIQYVDQDCITAHILNDILCTNTTFDSVQSALQTKVKELKSNDYSSANSLLLQA